MLSTKEITGYVQDENSTLLKAVGADGNITNVPEEATMKAKEKHSDSQSKQIQHIATPEVRIVGVNTDKTRRKSGSETLYRVYFTLSENPPNVWRSLFAEDWKALGKIKPQLQHEANIDGAFLSIDCLLVEVADILLPALKQAVAATNTSYTDFVRQEGREKTRKENVWKDERAAVDQMARPLKFE